jgi:hypothetical protein
LSLLSAARAATRRADPAPPSPAEAGELTVVAARHAWRWVATAGALILVAHNGLVKALQAAVNQLISAGDYAKILARWNLSNEAVTTSEINPPGLPIEGK